MTATTRTTIRRGSCGPPPPQEKDRSRHETRVTMVALPLRQNSNGSGQASKRRRNWVHSILQSGEVERFRVIKIFCMSRADTSGSRCVCGGRRRIAVIGGPRWQHRGFHAYQLRSINSTAGDDQRSAAGSWSFTRPAVWRRGVARSPRWSCDRVVSAAGVQGLLID